MEPSGEKPDLLTDSAGASHFSGQRSDASNAAPRDWTKKEKDERSEWFLIAGFIATVGVGILGIGLFGLIFWTKRGPDLMVDVFVCSMAVMMGLVFLILAGAGFYRLSRAKPTQSTEGNR